MTATADRVGAAFARRAAPGLALVAEAEPIALASRALAAMFQAGGTLLVSGTPADTAHVIVEFLHPVITGSRALPAVAVHTPEAVALLGRPGDALLAITSSGHAPPGLDAARERGLLTVALRADGDDVRADHALVVRSQDGTVVRELQVTTYHLLWELVQVFLEHPAGAEERCTTCGDIAVTVPVVALLPDALATVETATGTEEVSVALVDAQVGDLVLVHAKEAIGVVGRR
jgi:D-sedoheptulose 7-phosphate isomerase